MAPLPISSTIQGTYSPSLVVLSVLVAMVASYTALELSDRVAVTRVHRQGRIQTWHVWLGAGATSMGIGIWSMHFVGMLAFSLPVAMVYHGPLVVLSVVVAIGASTVALGVASRASLRFKTLISAGIAMGIAIAGMHYIGMAAMQLDAVVTYDPWIFAASVIIAITASIAALWLAFALRRDGEDTVHWPIRIGAAVVMGSAIAGMHYTGMAAAQFTPILGQVTGHHMHTDGVAGTYLGAIGIAAGAFLLLKVALISAWLDRREQWRLRRMHEEMEHRVAEQARELEQTTAQLLHAQRMETVGQLAGGVAHDFNNLLTAILGSTEFIAANIALDSPIRRDVEQIEFAATRATALVRQLLTFSRRQVVEPRLLDLSEAVDHLLPMLRRLIPADIILAARLAKAPAWLQADPVQIEQILTNLVINARDAMPNGGTVTIETTHVDLQDADTVLLPGVNPGAYILLTVSDTGVGMDAATQARIFDPFFTTKEQGKGTGLGLASVYGIVKQSSGDIVVRSAVGEGAHFSIYLPQVQPKAEVALPSLRSSPPCGSETILVVEDNPAIRDVVVRTLGKAGYTVLEAADGMEALTLCKERGPCIHLILSDVVMPRMRGPELGRNVRLLYPDMKLLFMSGYAEEINTHDATYTDLHASFLGKPFKPQALIHKVREILDVSVSSVGHT